MSLLDTVKDGFQKFLPQRKGSLPPPTHGMGIGNGARPFDDDMIVSKPSIVFHASQTFFTFLALCCFASVASFQAQYKVGPSGLSGFAIFLAVMLIVLSMFMLLVPVIYEKYNKMVRLARALKEDRVAFILTGTGLSCITLISLITTISAWTEPGCKDPTKDPSAGEHKDDGFVSGLSGWCTTKKAGAVFFWLATIFWICTSVQVILEWRSGKTIRPRDPPFAHPEDAEGYAESVTTRNTGREEEEEEEIQQPSYAPVAARPPQLSPIRGPGESLSFPTPSPFSDEHRYVPPEPQPRASMDTYGAFNDPLPSGYGPAAVQPPVVSPGVSRTMQYADPYAAVRASVAQPPAVSPPSYTGYR
ncbi:hypothetical protein SISNIDRAFT_486422 [Sistotremastrum niveocremeum HHB9708]|uniref:Uncharacterized protein n=1 Tax=Sistotremastrum niveocremeum HHB9708 TaxID=1314777 RepID=A0A164TI52_9AGAM|nr:hypothetical protein SISNIDRAFT_486422 [Sistotremastrum niveocremeum HHB9708]